MANVIIIAIAFVYALAQGAPQVLYGNWTAQVAGQTYARLELTDTNGVVGGRVSVGSIHLDPQGVVDRVLEQPQTLSPIFNVVVRDGVVSFASKNDEGDTVQFELRLVGSQAELALLFDKEFLAELASGGIAVPKPFPLTKVAR